MTEFPEDLDLANPEFLQAWNLVRHTNKSLFLTGKAGTGKSTFLRYICRHTKKKHVVTAPTGIAAVNVGGVTMHSFFQIPLRPIPPDDPDYTFQRILKKVKLRKDKVRLIRAVELIIIDEVSMVRPDMIDFIDRLLRAVTGKRKEPFGGKQMLLVGDIFQLEPVVTPDTRTILSRHYDGFFFFNAKAYSQIPLVSIELKKVYRQNDAGFVAILDRIRMNRPTPDDMRLLNSRYARNIPTSECDGNDFVMTIASRRDLADAINSRQMELNPNEEVVFEGIIEGDFPERSLPTDIRLCVKKDEQIILLKNDKEKRWVNGTIARVDGIDTDSIRIRLENGSTHALEREIWENIKYTYDENSKRVNEEIIGRFTQFPIKAAWALTVHKSQGLTFNNVDIELGQGAFSAGQTYVALSRCRSLDGLRLHSPITSRDVIVSQGAVEFAGSFNDCQQINSALEEARARILYAEALESFDNNDITEATTKTAEALRLTGDLNNPAVVRFIASKLKVINRLEDEISRLRDDMESLASEYIEMGNECLEIEGAAKAALSNFNKALRLSPSHPEAISGHIRSLIALGRFIEAGSEIGSAEEHKTLPVLDLEILSGECALSSGTPDDALVHFTAALKLDKKNARLHDLIADSCEALEMDDMAAVHREKAAKLRSRRKKS